MELVQLILLIFFFIFLSGVMALTDAAVLSVSAAEIETMVKRRKRGAAALKKVYDHITRGVVVIVAFTNTVNVFGPIIVGQKAVDIYGDPIIGIITAVLTFGTIIFSEIIPKSLGVHYAPKISRAAAPLILVFTNVLFPLVVLLEIISKLMQRGTRRVGTEEQIRSLVRLGSASGYIAKEEDKIIHRVFVLNDRTAGEMMTPFGRAAVLDRSTRIKDAVTFIRDKRYSRYPVVEEADGKSGRAGEKRGIVGTVLAADIFEHALFEERGSTVGDIMSPPIFVDAAETADDIMLQFKRERKHMAIVRRGVTPFGVVTFEDILEELVGEIEDERD